MPRDGSAFAGRVKKAIEDSIDPFGEVAEARKKKAEEAERKKEDEQRQEALAQAATSGPAAGSKKPMTRAEKKEMAAASFVFDEVVLPALLLEECFRLAEDGVKRVTWTESLAGRLDETIADGPMDYDALELLLAQERMKAARIHAAEQRKAMEEAAHSDKKWQAAMSMGGIALAANAGVTTPLGKVDKAAAKDDDDYSAADSQDEIDTLLSSDWGGGQAY